MSDEAILRAALEEQWHHNHSEHCGGWDHDRATPCYWPKPVVLGGDPSEHRMYDEPQSTYKPLWNLDGTMGPGHPDLKANVCPTCHQTIVKEAHGGEHPSAGDHDPAFHVAAAYGSSTREENQHLT